MNGIQPARELGRYWPLLLLFSFTRLLIECWNNSGSLDFKRCKLLAWNVGWFAIEICGLLMLRAANPELFPTVAKFAFCMFAYWRINEVVYAFFTDGISKLNREKSSSNLTPSERILMLVRSVFGLVFWFAILYFFHQETGSFSKYLGDFWDAWYFSATTQFAIGQEGQEVGTPLIRALHIYQGATGILLFVFALSIYLGQGAKSSSLEKRLLRRLNRLRRNRCPRCTLIASRKPKAK